MELLVSLLIVVLILGVLFYVIQLLPLPEPWRMIVILIVALIVIIYLLRLLLGVPLPALR